jgi:hypothetical protein
MGTHGSPPTRVLEVPVKWTRPTISPVDMQMGPETLSTVQMTSEDLGRPYPDRGRPARLAGQVPPLDHGGGATSRPEDRGILSVITEDDLPNL